MGDNFSDIHNSEITNRSEIHYHGHAPRKASGQPPMVLNEIRACIQRGDLESALDMADDFLTGYLDQEALNALAIIRGEFVRLSRQVIKNTIPDEVAKRETNALADRLLNLIGGWKG
ncbi:hypothetical protein [Pontibacter sp. G13]|uniref:hypothetical protein n=1 Tax=Pontibacter sp. G13 TaxID=3074898 RepID=UPI00288B78E4|nr:hypothetical protein [Pontibacter sp. G13]WNJ20463.1 hypothetical protein RJD25_08275 [Pontibacter sp. G13]